MLIHNKGQNSFSTTGVDSSLKANTVYNAENQLAKKLLNSYPNEFEAIEYIYYHATNNQCPICFITLKTSPTNRSQHDSYNYECLRCGNFSITATAREDKQNLNEEKRAYLSHKIRLGIIEKVTSNIFSEVNSIDSNTLTTSTQERINNLISYLHKQSKEIGDPIHLTILALEAIIGTSQIHANYFKKTQDLVNYKGHGSVYYLLQHLEEKKLLHILETSDSIKIALTIEGLEYYEKLKTSKSEAASDVAFFALQFPRNSKTALDKKLGKFYEECKSQLQQIGVKLINPLLAEPKNGNISNRLENEIIKSKFLIADLSHDNSGAYWEAGFAHGLNKKVFYTCHEKEKTHFDVNQHYTIFWNDNNVKEKAEELKNAVKRSFI